MFSKKAMEKKSNFEIDSEDLNIIYHFQKTITGLQKKCIIMQNLF